MTSFRNIVVSFSYRQGVSVLLHFFQILNESLSYTKYLFDCLFPCQGTTLLYVITQRGVVISYRRFGKTYRSHLQTSSIFSWTLRTGPISCPETSVKKLPLLAA